MNRLLFLVIFIASTLSSVVSAQQPGYNSGSAGESSVVTTPEQLRRVAPPATDLTPQQLEDQADSLRAQKAFADSLDYYREAIKKKPSAALYNKAGIAELLLLRYDDAKKDFERSIKAEPSYAEAYNNLGVAYYSKHNLKKAIKYYSEAIKHRDESASFHSNLGTALFSRKEFDKASQQYTRALELDPDIFERQSRTGISMQLSSPQDRAHYSYVVAKMFAARGDTEHCLLYLKKAMEEGYPVASKFNHEAEFEKVKKDPRIIGLLNSPPVSLPN